MHGEWVAEARALGENFAGLRSRVRWEAPYSVPMSLVRSVFPLVCAAMASSTASVGATLAFVPGCGGVAIVRPNIVLVVSDDQDYEHFGFVGNSVVHTPTLDRLAESGTIFSVMHTPARCRPSLASLLSGRYPHQSGIYYNRGPSELSRDGALPLLLRDAGYATFAGGKYWEGDPGRLGFDVADSEHLHFVREGQESLFEFIETHAGTRPMFVWWAPQIPHMPHDAPEEFSARIDRDAIVLPAWFEGDAEIFRTFEHDLMAMEAWFDDGLARLVAKFEETGAFQNTLFVFLNDNGYSNGLISKGSPFEKGVRTPSFVTWPGHIPSQRLGALVASVDLYATVLDYAGVSAPDGPARSLRPLIDGDQKVGREVLYGAVYERTASEGADPARDVFGLYARGARWKYVVFPKAVPAGMWEITRATPMGRHDRLLGEENFYDLDADPYERNDLSTDPDAREQMNRMRNDVLAWWRQTGGGELNLP